jgi:hypothetical protein
MCCVGHMKMLEQAKKVGTCLYQVCVCVFVCVCECVCVLCGPCYEGPFNAISMLHECHLIAVRMSPVYIVCVCLCV